jgi:hypothetical protein
LPCIHHLRIKELKMRYDKILQDNGIKKATVLRL